MKRPFTQDEVKELVSRGYDMSDYNGEEAEFPDPPPTSALAAGGRSILASALPTAAGGAGFAAGMKGGAAIGALTGPAAPVAVPVLGILGGLGGGYLAGKAGAAIQEPLMSEEFKQQIATDTQQHPWATTAGTLATMPFGGFNPSIANLAKAGGAVGRLATRLPTTVAERRALMNVGSGAALGGIQEAVLAPMEGREITAKDIAFGVATGGLFSRPNIIGKNLYGFHDGTSRVVETPAALAKRLAAANAKQRTPIARVQPNLTMEEHINRSLGVPTLNKDNTPRIGKSAETSGKNISDLLKKGTEPVSRESIQGDVDKRVKAILEKEQKAQKSTSEAPSGPTIPSTELKTEVASALKAKNLSAALTPEYADAVIKEILNERGIQVAPDGSLPINGKAFFDKGTRKVLFNPNTASIDTLPHEGLHHMRWDLEAARDAGSKEAAANLAAWDKLNAAELAKINEQRKAAGLPEQDAHEFAISQQGFEFVKQQLNLKRETPWKRWWADTKALFNAKYNTDKVSLEDMRRAVNFKFVHERQKLRTQVGNKQEREQPFGEEMDPEDPNTWDEETTEIVENEFTAFLKSMDSHEKLGTKIPGLSKEAQARIDAKRAAKLARNQPEGEGLNKEYRLVNLRKPDGTTEEVYFNDKYYGDDVAKLLGFKPASVARLTEDGKLSHGTTRKGEVIEELSREQPEREGLSDGGDITDVTTKAVSVDDVLKRSKKNEEVIGKFRKLLEYKGASNLDDGQVESILRDAYRNKSAYEKLRDILGDLDADQILDDYEPVMTHDALVDKTMRLDFQTRHPNPRNQPEGEGLDIHKLDESPISHAAIKKQYSSHSDVPNNYGSSTAVLRNKNTDEVYTGRTHAQAYQKIVDRNDSGSFEQGFLTDKGDYWPKYNNIHTDVHVEPVFSKEANDKIVKLDREFLETEDISKRFDILDKIDEIRKAERRYQPEGEGLSNDFTPKPARKRTYSPEQLAEQRRRMKIVDARNAAEYDKAVKPDERRTAGVKPHTYPEDREWTALFDTRKNTPPRRIPLSDVVNLETREGMADFNSYVRRAVYTAANRIRAEKKGADLPPSYDPQSKTYGIGRQDYDEIAATVAADVKANGVDRDNYQGAGAMTLKRTLYRRARDAWKEAIRIKSQEKGQRSLDKEVGEEGKATVLDVTPDTTETQTRATVVPEVKKGMTPQEAAAAKVKALEEERATTVEEYGENSDAVGEIDNEIEMWSKRAGRGQGEGEGLEASPGTRDSVIKYGLEEDESRMARALIRGEKLIGHFNTHPPELDTIAANTALDSRIIDGRRIIFHNSTEGKEALNYYRVVSANHRDGLYKGKYEQQLRDYGKAYGYRQDEIDGFIKNFDRYQGEGEGLLTEKEQQAKTLNPEWRQDQKEEQDSLYRRAPVSDSKKKFDKMRAAASREQPEGEGLADATLAQRFTEDFVGRKHYPQISADKRAMLSDKQSGVYKTWERKGYTADEGAERTATHEAFHAFWDDNRKVFYDEIKNRITERSISADEIRRFLDVIPAEYTELRNRIRDARNAYVNETLQPGHMEYRSPGVIATTISDAMNETLARRVASERDTDFIRHFSETFIGSKFADAVDQAFTGDTAYKNFAKYDEKTKQYYQEEDEGLGTGRHSFFNAMAPTFDKVKTINPELGDAFDKWEIAKRGYTGMRNEALAALQKFNPEDVRRVAELRREAFREDSAEPLNLTGEDISINEALKKYYFDDIGMARQNLGLLIDNRAAGTNENYQPDMLNEQTIDLFVSRPNSPEALYAVNRWAEYVAEHSEGEISFSEARKHINDYIDAIGGKTDNYKAVNFGAIRKAQGYGLPDELRELDPLKTLSRYGSRAASDLAMFQELESKPAIAAALKIPNPNTGKIPDHPNAEMRYSAQKEVRNAMKWVMNDFGNTLSKSQPHVNAFVRLVHNSLLGGATGLRDLASVPVNMIPYIHSFSDLSTALHGMVNFREHAADALRSGAKQPNLDLVQFNTILDSTSRGLDLMHKAATAMRKWQGREALENLSRDIVFAAGKELALTHIEGARNGNRNSEKFIEKFGKGTEGKTGEEVANIMAANFTERNQGTYGGRGLPVGIVESQFAPFFSLQKWGIEKANVIFQDVFKPALAGENYVPLLTYSLGTILTGAAIQEMNKLLMGRKPQDPDIKEALAKGDAKAYAQELATLMQLGSFSGIVGDVMKASVDASVRGKTSRNVVSFPTYTAVADTGEKLTDMAEAIRQGENPWEVIKMFSIDMLSQNIQNVRALVNHTVKNRDLERSDKFRDRRIYNELEGKPAGEIPKMNRYLGIEERKFKQASTPAEILELLPQVLAKAKRQAKGNPEKLRQAIVSLKGNSYQTMPSPTDSPYEFRAYYDYLVKTQGKTEADKRVKDYLMQRMLNQRKSRLLPAVKR